MAKTIRLIEDPLYERQAAYAQRAADKAAAIAFHKAWWRWERNHTLTEADVELLKGEK